MSYKHKCAYDGDVLLWNGYEIRFLPCKNEVTQNKIFCRDCFQSVTPQMRRNWGVVFPYDVPYDLVMKSPIHYDQKLVVEQMRKSITQAKLQLSLF